MDRELNFNGVTSTNWKNVAEKEIATGIFERALWEGKNGKRAVVFEFKADSISGNRFSSIRARANICYLRGIQ